MILSLPVPEYILISKENWEVFVTNLKHGFLKILDEYDIELEDVNPKKATEYFELKWNEYRFTLPSTAGVREKAVSNVFENIENIFNNYRIFSKRKCIFSGEIYESLVCEKGKDIEFSILYQNLISLKHLLITDDPALPRL